MRKPISFFVMVLTLSLTTAASAQPNNPDAHGIGFGVEQTLSGLTGAAFSYDAGKFHIDVITALAHFGEDGPDTTQFGVGGRFFFTVHDMGAADFSLGGGLALIRTSVNDNSDTEIDFEAAAQIRVFLVPNVALLASLGFVLLTADENEVGGGPIAGNNSSDSFFGFGGQLNGSFGLIYYFH